MEPDYLYDNAPLIEVISEVRWSLTALASMPGNFIDPNFSATSEEFLSLAKKAGFSHVERLIPEQIPLELIAGQPVFRLRRKENAWPLYQLGPGLMTCNIVPKYHGWSDFREYIHQGIEFLQASFPSPEKLLRLETLELRYIDGFTDAHGLQDNAFLQFSEQYLGTTVSLPVGFLQKFAQSEKDATAATEIKVSAKEPENTNLIIKFAPGQKREGDREIPALIVELRASHSGGKKSFVPEEVMDWMDSAHSMLHEAFDDLCTEELKTRMGPRNMIGKQR